MIGIDLLVICLLSVTIAYCRILSSRLDNMRISFAEISLITKNLSKFIAKANDDIRNIEGVLEDFDQAMFEKTAESKKILDDLSFMVERADRLADSLSCTISADNAMKKRMHEKSTSKYAKQQYGNDFLDESVGNEIDDDFREVSKSKGDTLSDLLLGLTKKKFINQ